MTAREYEWMNKKKKDNGKIKLCTEGYLPYKIRLHCANPHVVKKIPVILSNNSNKINLVHYDRHLISTYTH